METDNKYILNNDNNLQNNGGGPKTDRKQLKGLGCRQFRIMMRKNLLTKRRLCSQTCCELVTPICLILFLVIGYRLSLASETTLVATNYANQTLQVASLIQNTYDTLQKAGFGIGPGKINPIELGPGGTIGLTPNATRILTAQISSVARTFFTELFAYTGPLPVPTFDQFVGLNRLLRAGITVAAQQFGIVDIQRYINTLLLVDQRFQNIITLGQLVFVPDNDQTRRLVQRLNQTYTYFDESFDRFFDDPQAAEDYATRDYTLDADYDPQNPQKSLTWAVIVFDALDVEAGVIDYTLRLNYSVTATTKSVVNKFALGLDQTYQKYVYSGFSTLQQMIENYMLGGAQHAAGFIPSDLRGSESSFVGIPMPLPSVLQNKFYTGSGPFISLLICMYLLYPLSRLLKGVVEEKENRTKETMKMMGLYQWVFVSSHFCTALIIFTFIAFVASLLMVGSFLRHSTWTLIFVHIWLFNLSMIGFALFLSVFFNRAKLAGIVGPLITFVLVIPRYAFFTGDDTDALQAKFAASLLSPTAMAFSYDLLMNYEGANLGMNWGNIYNDPYSFSDTLVFLILDFFIYATLGWYLEHVLPNEYGTNLKPWFIFTRAYWVPQERQVKEREKLVKQTSDSHLSGNGNGNRNDEPHNNVQSSVEETVPREMEDKKRVTIQHLYKKFTIGSAFACGAGRRRVKTAVRDLSLNMYEGQVTALLGHNGAGKTTTISILTGLVSPTSGTCSINGFNVAGEMDLIRTSLGVCPQHNVLFDMLTVREHLVHFATLKGVPPQNIDREVQKKIDEVGLTEKADVYSMALSGGQKRKLSVAIALIGDSKIVFLDEPTSGMDPYSRRATWDLLKRSKAGRVIVLTTHFMDEADLLGDRIAIMSLGRLRCVGSSLFLKSRYGVGYNLTMVRSSIDCNMTNVFGAVRGFVSTAEIVSEAGGELAFRLPLASVSNFAALFRHLDEHKQDLHIGAYGISMTTLEEVFLRIAQEVDEDEEEEARKILSNRPDFHQLVVNPTQSQPGVPMTRLGSRLGLTPDPHDVELSKLNESKNSTTSPNAAAAGGGGASDGSSPTTSGALEKRPSISATRHSHSHSHSEQTNGVTAVKKGGTDEADGTDSMKGDHSVNHSTGGGATGGVTGAETGSASHSRQHTGDSAANLVGAKSTGPLLSDDDSHRYPPANFSRQFVELFKKRVYCAVRDLRGRFFEIILPIVVVALVLLILTININQAGPSIALNADLYADASRAATPSSLRQPEEIMYTTGNTQKLDNGVLYFMGDHEADGCVDLPLTPDCVAALSTSPFLPSRTYLTDPMTGTSVDNYFVLNNNNSSSPKSSSSALSDYMLTTFYHHGFSTRLDAYVFNDNQPVLDFDINAFINQQLNSLGLSTLVSDANVQALINALQLGINFLNGRNATSYTINLNAFGLSLNNLDPASVERLLNDLSQLLGPGFSFNFTLPTLLNNGILVGNLNLTEILSLIPVNLEISFNQTSLVFPNLPFGTTITIPGLNFTLVLPANTTLTIPIFNFLRLNDTVSLQFVLGTAPITLTYPNGTIIATLPAFDANIGIPIVDLSALERVLGFNTTTFTFEFSIPDLNRLLGNLTNDLIQQFNSIPGFTFNGYNITISFGGFNLTLPFTAASLESLITQLNILQQLRAFSLFSPNSIVFNASAFHSLPIGGAYLTETRLALLHSNLTALSPLAFVSKYMTDAVLPSNAYPKTSYVLRAHPLPLTLRATLTTRAVLSVLAAVFTLIPFCYIPASFVIFIVKERTSKAKHLQLVSGVNPTAFWLSTYVWDMINYTFIVLCVLIVFGGYNTDEFVGTSRAFGATFLLLLLYGFAVIPLSYCWSFLFENHSSAQVGVAGINFLFGFILTIAAYILDTIDSTVNTNQALKPYYRLLPPYNLGEGLISLSTRTLYTLVLGTSSDPLDWDQTGRNLLYLFLESIGYFILTLLIEYDMFRALWRTAKRNVMKVYYHFRPQARPASELFKDDPQSGAHHGDGQQPTDGHHRFDRWSVDKTKHSENSKSGSTSNRVVVKEAGIAITVAGGHDDEESKQGEAHPLAPEEMTEDEDVTTERLRVDSGGADQDVVKIKHLRKEFTPKGNLKKTTVAVRDLCLGIPSGQCFGFLGVNGAGKTTTMSILTGDFLPTSGEATVHGYDVIRQLVEVRREIGYCPQFDPLLDLMTAREHLQMFARLRGLPAHKIQPVVNSLLDRLGLRAFENQTTEGYSGGTKRKLSLAIALIGDPSVIFLDEPSTGMDPVSRRFMWDVISGISKHTSIVLTTHSMEECEALCSRLGIMAKGALQCLGSIQHLKSRFGKGYHLEINTRDTPDALENVKTFVQETFQSAELQEFHAGRIKYQIPQQNMSLSAIFGSIENAKERLNIVDYAVSQATLEQIFVHIAKES